MGWHKRMCRFGHIHHVFEQEATNSCGPSCALMLFQRLRRVKLDTAESYLGFSAYAQINAKYDGSQGTRGSEMARFLKNVLGTPTQYHNPKLAVDVITGVYDNVSKGHPVVMGVIWLVGRRHAGGHWIVVDKVTQRFGKTYFCVNDPGDGHVHVIKIDPYQSPQYTPTYDGRVQTGELDDYIEFTNLP